MANKIFNLQQKSQQSSFQFITFTQNIGLEIIDMLRLPHKVFQIWIRILPILTPFTSWLYRSQFNRKIATRLLLFFAITPIIGYFRRPFVIRAFKQQIQSQIQTKQAEMKQQLGQIKLDLNSNSFYEYLIVVKADNVMDDSQLFEKQKSLFILNNEIIQKVSQNAQNYFQGVKFLYLGQDRIYKGLQQNISQQNNHFQYISKKQQTKSSEMMLPKQDKIMLVARDENGQNKILMEWGFNKDISLKAILRQISKHKHKKYLKSMNF